MYRTYIVGMQWRTQKVDDQQMMNNNIIINLQKYEIITILKNTSIRVIQYTGGDDSG